MRVAQIPVLTKIDLALSDPEMALKQMHTALGMFLLSLLVMQSPCHHRPHVHSAINPDTVLWTSAKSGEGCDEIFPAVLRRLPCPTGSRDAPLQCLLFDSWFDEYRGVVCVISVVNGKVNVGAEIVAASTGRKYTVHELGLVTPSYYPVQSLAAGQVRLELPFVFTNFCLRVHSVYCDCGRWVTSSLG